MRRTKLLQPYREVSNLFLYCLGVLSARFGIEVHAFTVMSNHYHMVVTDTQGCLPRFLAAFHRILALGIKVLRRWEGSVWDSDKPSVVQLRTDQAVVEAIAYCMANPVAAGAVRHARLWPGLIVLPERLGRVTYTARLPSFYFDSDNPDWPATASLRLTLPPVRMAEAKLRAEVRSELAHLELEAQRDMEANGRRFLGPERVLAASPYDRATSWEPVRSRNPTFAVGRGQPDAYREAVVVLRAFRAAYRTALGAWRIGLREVVFPAGTWLMAQLHAASVAPT